MFHGGPQGPAPGLCPVSSWLISAQGHAVGVEPSLRLVKQDTGPRRGHPCPRRTQSEVVTCAEGPRAPSPCPTHSPSDPFIQQERTGLPGVPAEREDGARREGRGLQQGHPAQPKVNQLASRVSPGQPVRRLPSPQATAPHSRIFQRKEILVSVPALPFITHLGVWGKSLRFPGRVPAA